MLKPIGWIRGIDPDEVAAQRAKMGRMAELVELVVEVGPGEVSWRQRKAGREVAMAMMRNGAAQRVIIPSMLTIGTDPLAVADFFAIAASHGTKLLCLAEAINLDEEAGQGFATGCRALLSLPCAPPLPAAEARQRLTRARFGFRYGSAQGGVMPPRQGTDEQRELVANPEEHKALEVIAELMANWHETGLGKAAYEAAQQLNKMSIVHPRTQKRWHAGSVKNIWATYLARQSADTDRIVAAAMAAGS